MKKQLEIGLILFVLACIPFPAFGYIDPGLGHFIWQTLIATFFGGVFLFRRLFFFKNKGSKGDQS